MVFPSRLKVEYALLHSDVDQFRVARVETSMGYVGWLGHVEATESVFTQILRKLGAVLYGL
jgi:hypothetical protein